MRVADGSWWPLSEQDAEGHVTLLSPPGRLDEAWPARTQETGEQAPQEVIRTRSEASQRLVGGGGVEVSRVPGPSWLGDLPLGRELSLPRQQAAPTLRSVRVSADNAVRHWCTRWCGERRGLTVKAAQPNGVPSQPFGQVSAPQMLQLPKLTS